MVLNAQVINPPIRRPEFNLDCYQGKEAVTLFNRLLGRGVLIGAEAAASLMAGDETSEDDLLRSVTEGITPARRTAYVRDLYTTLIESEGHALGLSDIHTTPDGKAR
eukprot:1263855-Amorphochlora_amoeboformis.AAC.1